MGALRKLSYESLILVLITQEHSGVMLTQDILNAMILDTQRGSIKTGHTRLKLILKA